MKENNVVKDLIQTYEAQILMVKEKIAYQKRYRNRWWSEHHTELPRLEKVLEENYKILENLKESL